MPEALARPTWRPRRDETIVWRELEREVLVLSDQGLTLRVLNSTASAVWKLCDGSRTVEEIAVEIAALFEVDRETAERDTADFIETMVAHGLVRADRSVPA